MILLMLGKVVVYIGTKRFTYTYNADLNEFFISKCALDISKHCHEVKKKPLCNVELIIELKYILSRNIKGVEHYTFKNKGVTINVIHYPQELYLPNLSETSSCSSKCETDYGHESSEKSE